VIFLLQFFSFATGFEFRSKHDYFNDKCQGAEAIF